jgi:hypothetical protein
MMKRTTITIDPGASGAVAWEYDGDHVAVANMPMGMSEQADFLRELAVMNQGRETRIYIERVGSYMPGNSATAAVKFARHCGHLEAVCYMLGMPVEYVAPQTWMKAVGALPKDKAERKRAIKEAMARRYPNLKVTLTNADALAMMEWARARP